MSSEGWEKLPQSKMGERIMAETSGKKKKLESIDDFVSASQTQKTAKSEKQATSAATDVGEFADIAANSFFKILLNSELSAVEKQKAVAKELSFAKNKEQAKQSLEEFNKMKEYLQHERKRMAREIISLTDTEAFSELKDVYEDINTALMDFENRISPLTNIVDAVYTLRMNGVTFDIFNEIAKDKEAEEQRMIKLRELGQELFDLENSIKEARISNNMLREEKSFFGFGGIKEAARQQIAENNANLDDYYVRMQNLNNEIEALSVETARDSEFAEYAEEKARLRELLDISSEEHKSRQEGLIAAATGFIDTTETRVASVLTHFNGMNNQIERLGDANYTMREIYAILNDATDKAGTANQAKRDELSTDADGEGDIQKMERERQLRDLENHISALGQSNVDTTQVFAELTSAGHRIKSMKDGNEQQVSKTRALHTSGVAGVADQLSTVLQAVSSAALGESSEMARMSLERMNETTRSLGQKEVIRVALGTKEVNSELSKALADLEQYGDVINTATSITREGLSETKRLLGELEETANSVQKDIKKSTGVAADVAAGESDMPTPEAAKSTAPNPFDLA
ncbi:MAG: hypothetical protein ACJAZW_001670 [Maritalea sp.]